MTENLKRVFTPPTDIIELDNRIVVMAEIAAMKPEDFTITLKGRQLIIKGSRNRALEHVKAFHQLEIGFGDFRIDIALPWPADAEKVTANYSEGFLKVELPRRSEKTIPITQQGNKQGTTKNDD